MLLISWFIFKVEVAQQTKEYSSVSNNPPDGEDSRPTSPARLTTQSGLPNVPPPTECWLIRSGATNASQLSTGDREPTVPRQQGYKALVAT